MECAEGEDARRKEIFVKDPGSCVEGSAVDGSYARKRLRLCSMVLELLPSFHGTSTLGGMSRTY